MTASYPSKQAVNRHRSPQRRRTDYNVQRRNRLLKNARETLSILSSGGYVDADGGVFFVSSPTADAFDRTVLYPADSPVLTRDVAPGSSETEFEFRQAHPVAAALARDDDARVGILNAGCAKQAPTSFLNGGDDAEAALLRSSTFDAAQRSPAAMEWYRANRTAPAPAHLLYTPDVRIIRDAAGRLVRPRPVDVVTVAASTPADQCARALALFRARGVRTLVLDTLGADVDSAARAWCELLACDDSPFRGAFERVVFAVAGHRFAEFRRAFEMHQYDAELTKALLS